MGTGSLVCVISLDDLHNPPKKRAERGSKGQERRGEVECGEKRAKDKKKDGNLSQRNKERD